MCGKKWGGYGFSCLRVIDDGGPWYRWALERLGLEYQRLGIRNRVERFFRYLKERTAIFDHKLSAKNLYK